MSFLATVEQARAFLERNRRVSLSALRLEFGLDTAEIQALVDELVDVQQVAAREGKVLSWVAPPGFDAPPAELAPVPSEPPPPTRAAEAERRQLTVLFCDLVGSTRLALDLDPEDWREVVRGYQAAAAEAIERFDGYIAQYLGDGLLAYFGYPQAHEDDPERAVRAGLAVAGAVTAGNAHLREQRGLELSVRIGAHTGPVVVGEMGGGERHESLALGDTVHIASRLQDVAEPGSVVISAATRSLLRTGFTFADLGSPPLKGVTDPMPCFRVVGEPGSVQLARRLRSHAGLTPLVGRDQEVALLLDRWELVTEGIGQVVLLAGEAGMGKSRLVEVLRDRLEDQPHIWLEGACSAYHENSAYYPLVNLLEQAFQFGEHDSAQTRVARLEEVLGGAGFDLPDGMAVFSELLSLPLPNSYAPLELSPEALRRKMLELLVRWLFSLAERQPVVLVVEDLHWIDPSSLELLGMLSEQVPTSTILLLCTFRPGFESPWADRTHLAHVTLNRLSRRQVQAMIDAITGGKTLPAQVIDRLADKMDGVPLFVEELTKTVLESGLLHARESRYELSGPLPELQIPATLQDSLMARLDRFGSVKDVAQLAAVLGREFSHQLLEAVSTMDSASLARALERLVGAELLYQRGVPPHATYTFKHALIQDTAYQSLLKSQRRESHARVAAVLVDRFPERASADPEGTARHYEEAERFVEAITHYERAGAAATARSANAEAIGHLRRGLDILQKLPESRQRHRQELTLQVGLGVPLIAARGYAHAEVAGTYERARELCQAVGSAPELSQALWGLNAYYVVRAELETAVELADQLLELAQETGEAAQLLWAHLGLGVPLYWQGQWATALKHLDQTTRLYEPSKHRAMAYAYGQDPGVVSRSFASLALWQLGYPDEALRRSEQAVERARDSGHPYSLALSLVFAAVTRQLRGERARMLELAEEAIAISKQEDFPVWLGTATAFRGWALLDGPTKENHIEEIQGGMAEVAATGTEVAGPFVLGLLADSNRRVGRKDDALGAVNVAKAVAVTKRSPFWDAELSRLEGEVVLLEGRRDEVAAESAFLRATEIAQAQSARSLQLRAVTSLARLWQRQGKTAEAREQLAAVLDSFTEGHETSDLTEATTLLDELS